MNKKTPTILVDPALAAVGRRAVAVRLSGGALAGRQRLRRPAGRFRRRAAARGLRGRQARKFDVFAGVMCGVFGIGLLLSFLTGDPRFMVAKESLATGAAGIAFLVSCFVGRPLIYHAALRMRAGKPEEIAESRPDVGHAAAVPAGVRGVLGGVGLRPLAEALLRIPLVFILPTTVMVTLSRVLIMVVLSVWNVRYIKGVPSRADRQKNHRNPGRYAGAVSDASPGTCDDRRGCGGEDAADPDRGQGVDKFSSVCRSSTGRCSAPSCRSASWPVPAPTAGPVARVRPCACAGHARGGGLDQPCREPGHEVLCLLRRVRVLRGQQHRPVLVPHPHGDLDALPQLVVRVAVLGHQPAVHLISSSSEAAASSAGSSACLDSK